MMEILLAWFWMCLILASIFWYAFLLFYVGAKGRTEIIALGRNLSKRPGGNEHAGNRPP